MALVLWVVVMYIEHLILYFRFAFSLLHCLRVLYKEKIIHCDLKPVIYLVFLFKEVCFCALRPIYYLFTILIVVVCNAVCRSVVLICIYFSNCFVSFWFKGKYFATTKRAKRHQSNRLWLKLLRTSKRYFYTVDLPILSVPNVSYQHELSPG